MSRRRREPYRLRWPDPVRDGVLARLLALNRRRAAGGGAAGRGGDEAAEMFPGGEAVTAPALDAFGGA